MIRQSLLIFFAIACVQFGCAVEVGNPRQEEETKLKLVIQGTLPSGAEFHFKKNKGPSRVAETGIPVLATDGTSVEGLISLDRAFVSLKEINFKNESDDAAEKSEIDFKGPFITDLLTNRVNPALPVIPILPGAYNRVTMKLAKFENEDLNPTLFQPPEAIFGNSIYLEGNFRSYLDSGNGEDIPFRLSFSLDEEFTLAPEGQTSSFSLSSGKTNQFVVDFRLGEWFRFDNPETNSDLFSFKDLTIGGKLVLSEDSDGDNQKVWEIIKENIKESADYGLDEDEDGEPDFRR